MGGRSNSSPPVDTPPGGGTYPVDQFGNAYNPAWGGSDYSALGSALGKGIGTGAQQLAAGMIDKTNYLTGAGGYSQPGIPGSAPQQDYVGTQHGSMIPQAGGGTDLMAVLKRLLGGLS